MYIFEYGLMRCDDILYCKENSQLYAGFLLQLKSSGLILQVGSSWGEGQISVSELVWCS